MKKGSNKIFQVCMICFMSILVFSAGGQLFAADKIELVFASWRNDDSAAMDKVLAVYNKAHPGIVVKFSPSADAEYDAQLTAALQTGSGPDIVFLPSFRDGRAIYDGGFLHLLDNDIPLLKDFPASARKAWATDDGKMYAVPIFGVTHGIYYQKKYFKKYNLKKPETWDEFIKLCQTLKNNGETVFAQGTMDQWTLNEVVLAAMGPNFYGGEKSRQALMAGKMKVTDAPFVKSFERLKELQPFFPKGYRGLDYVSMQQMFAAGNAAMFIGGSWEIGVFKGMGATDIGWFASPVEKKGDKMSYCFHVDSGIGINKDSKHFKEAMDFIKWVATPEYAQLVMKEIPGFYAYTPGNFKLDDELAKDMLETAKTADITIRVMSEKLSDQTPSGATLLNEALIKMLTDELTPKEAAEYIQKGLATWYKPFQK